MTAQSWLRSIACISFLAALPAMGETFGDFTYTDNGADITITDCTATGAVTIPSLIGGKPVTTLGPTAFLSKSAITSIAIPSSVTAIGERAFSDCDGLTSIAIPSSVTTIGNYAFWGCDGLTSIVIPSSVTLLGSFVFDGCGNLTSATLASGLASIPDGLFRNCKKLSNVTLPDTLTTIGGNAFRFCVALKTMGLPTGLTTIGDAAFANSGITAIDLPETLTSIGGLAFNNCDQLISIRIPDSVTTIGNGLFSSSNQLKTVELSKGLKVLPQWTFQGCTLETLVIPTGVETIRGYCFMSCRKLRKVVLPASLKRVGIEAFFGCDSLVKLRFPTNLKKIDDRAFSGSGLLEVRFDGNAPDITAETFSGAPKHLKVFHVDGGKGFTWPTWEGFPTATLGSEIQLEDPRGSVVPTRISTQSFGARVIGYPHTKVYTIRNIGTRPLKKLAVELLANGGGDFTATTDQRGTSLEPGQAMKVKVTFRPTWTYERRAVLKIHSTDTNENPVTLKLRGVGM